MKTKQCTRASDNGGTWLLNHVLTKHKFLIYIIGLYIEISNNYIFTCNIFYILKNIYGFSAIAGDITILYMLTMFINLIFAFLAVLVVIQYFNFYRV